MFSIEKWRKFILLEASGLAPSVKYKTADLGLYSLCIKKIDDGYIMVLYQMILNKKNDCYILGYMRLNSSNFPCIPDTLQVQRVYVEPEVQGTKVGGLLYRLAFALGKKKGFGLTSDHEESTTASAARLWNKFANSSQYEKKKTKKGNDRFDYDNKTPDDPDDDCGGRDKDETLMGTTDKASAIHHSLIKKNTGYDEKLLGDLAIEHGKNKKYLQNMDLQTWEQTIIKRAMKRFHEIYKAG